MLSKAKETQLNAQLKGAGGYSRSFRWLFPMSDRKGFVGGWQAILIKATHLKAALAFDSVPTTSLQKKVKLQRKVQWKSVIILSCHDFVQCITMCKEIFTLFVVMTMIQVEIPDITFYTCAGKGRAGWASIVPVSRVVCHILEFYVVQKQSLILLDRKQKPFRLRKCVRGKPFPGSALSCTLHA